MKISNIKCQKFRVNATLVILGILENRKIMRRKHTLKKKKKHYKILKRKRKKKGRLWVLIVTPGTKNPIINKKKLTC